MGLGLGLGLGFGIGTRMRIRLRLGTSYVGIPLYKDSPLHEYLYIRIPLNRDAPKSVLDLQSSPVLVQKPDWSS